MKSTNPNFSLENCTFAPGAIRHGPASRTATTPHFSKFIL